MSSINPFKGKRNKRESDELMGGDNSFLDPFEIRSRFAELDRMAQRMFETAMSRGAKVLAAGPMYYGYSYGMGPDGKSHFKEFGNFKPTSPGLTQFEAREPFVDTMVDEKGNVAKVIAEMPGVQKEDIDLEVTENSLKIRAQHGERRYETSVPLTVSVDSNSAKANYHNGILEVKLRLKAQSRPKGTSVRVD